MLYSSFVSHFRRYVTNINRLFTYIAGLLVPLMIIIIVQDVVRRYLFNAPTTWALDVARFMMVYVFFLALGPALETGHHVSTDFFSNKYSETVKLVMTIITCCLTILFGIVLFVQLLMSTWEVIVTNRLFSTTNSIPMKYVYIITPIGTLQFILTTISLFLQNVQRVNKNKQAIKVDHEAAK